MNCHHDKRQQHTMPVMMRKETRQRVIINSNVVVSQELQHRTSGHTPHHSDTLQG